MKERIAALRVSARRLAALDGSVRSRALERYAGVIREATDALLRANRRDIEEHASSLSESLRERLKLDKDKIKVIADGVQQLASIPDPLGRLQNQTSLDEGLTLEKVTVPLGVLLIIFEARPDVIPQVISLALRTGNGVVLKGGAEAKHTNQAFMECLKVAQTELPADWAMLVEGREAVQELLGFDGLIDLVIPRGSSALVRYVMDHTKIPVLGHAEGICHLYVHVKADLPMALRIAMDAKCQYPAACNSIETLLLDREIALDFLPRLAEEAKVKGLTLKGCSETRRILPDAIAATDADWRTEYGNMTLAVKLVGGLEEAIRHINEFGSHHTDAIVSEDQDAIEEFLSQVDSASVMVNCSTRFADGFRYGLGAEVGISTGKIHARGPVGIEGLLTYQYRLRGSGQVVETYVGPKARAFLHSR